MAFVWLASVVKNKNAGAVQNYSKTISSTAFMAQTKAQTVVLKLLSVPFGADIVCVLILC